MTVPIEKIREALTWLETYATIYPEKWRRIIDAIDELEAARKEVERLDGLVHRAIAVLSAAHETYVASKLFEMKLHHEALRGILLAALSPKSTEGEG